MLWMLLMMNAMDRTDRVDSHCRMNERKEIPQNSNRPAGTGSGLGGLALLPALLFGGWLIIPLAGMVLSAVIAMFGTVFSGIGSLANGVFSGVTSVGAIAVGVLIGLALFFRVRNGKATENEDGEEAEEE